MHAKNLILLLSFSMSLSIASVFSEEIQEYKVIGEFGAIRTVYVSSRGIKDKNYIAQLLHKLVDKRHITEIWLFDDKLNTPVGVPMTDQQMLHWKAQYNFNPNTRHERFVFNEITNAKSSPPTIKEREENNTAVLPASREAACGNTSPMRPAPKRGRRKMVRTTVSSSQPIKKIDVYRSFDSIQINDDRKADGCFGSCNGDAKDHHDYSHL